MRLKLSEHSPKRATKIKIAISTPTAKPFKYTPEEAFALYIDGCFTKKSYILMQQGASYRHTNIYPNCIPLAANKKCFTTENSISIKMYLQK